METLQHIGTIDDLNQFIEDDSWMAVTFDGINKMILQTNDEELHQFTFGFQHAKDAEQILEHIASSLGTRFNGAEPVMHRMWKDHVLMAVHPSVSGKPWMRLFKKSYFANWVNPNFPA